MLPERAARNAVSTAALASLLALGGCYQAHELGAEGGPDPGEEDAAPRDAARIDAGRDAAPPPIDAGPPPFDAGRDAGPPRPDAGRDAGPPPIDAGPPPFDGGRDSGPPRRDAGRDAGRDSGPRDAGPPDAPRDAGRDTGTPDSGPRSIALRYAPDEFLLVPERPGLSVSGDQTYEMWIRARGPGTVSFKGNSSTGQQHHMLRIEGSGASAQIVVGWVTFRLDRREVRAPFGASMGRWTHVATVIRMGAFGARIELFVDFVLAATADVPNDLVDAFNTEPLRIGQFDGDTDEIRIWAAARPVDALRAQAFTRLPFGTAGLAAYWPLEEAPAGQIALDRSLRGIDAILGSGTTVDIFDPTWIFDGPIP
jgi:hypothetical protein